MSAGPASLTGRYRHYKGNDYVVLGFGHHSETEEEFVIYHPADQPDSLWLRPSTMFFETVMIGGKQIPRFMRLDDQTGDNTHG